MAEIPLSKQIACVKREINFRKRVYDRWVNEGRLERSEADEQIATMQAVLKTLEALPGSGTQQPLL